MRLVSYEFKNLVPFGDGEYYIIYQLTLEKKYLFGLVTKIFFMNYEINMFQSIIDFENHWDKLIKTKQKIRK